MSCIRRVALLVNCGYARACIYQNSNPGCKGQHARHSIDTPKRAINFRTQFSTYHIPEDYFEARSKDNTTQFDRDCNKILDGFMSKFSGGQDRQSYLSTFSHSKWCELSAVEKKQHSLANCNRCFELHKDCQLSFPLKPTYHPQPVITLNQDALQRQGVKKFTTEVLTELNRLYTNEGTSFTDAVIKTNCDLQKKGKTEKRQMKIHAQRQLTKKVNSHFAEKAAISMLTEGESKRKYHRKRLSQSFCSPGEQPPLKKKKTHSPDFSKVSWDTKKLRETLENWPIGTTINWSAVGREHEITGKNAGQVAKAFVEKYEINITHITTPKRKPTVRPCKRKLPSTEVSIPCNPSIQAIEAEILSMISSGRFTLGDECAPYGITKFTLVNGVLTPHVEYIQGRKVPRQA